MNIGPLPIPHKPVCRSQVPMRMRTWMATKHQPHYTCTYMTKCGKLSCDACSASWRSKVRAIINYGADALSGRDGYFTTFTIAGHHDKLPRLKQAFHNFRKQHLNKSLSGSYFFKIYELGGKYDRPHIHCLIYPSRPLLPDNTRIGKTQSLNSWQTSLNPLQLQFQKRLTKSGFGPIYHSERLRNGPKGATTYLGKYLAKANAKTLSINNRQIRVYETSRNWPRNRQFPLFLHGDCVYTKPDPTRLHQPTIPPLCQCKPTHPHELSRANRLAIQHWIRPFLYGHYPTIIMAIQNFITAYRRYYYYRATQKDQIAQESLLGKQLVGKTATKELARRYSRLTSCRNFIFFQLHYEGPIKLLFYLHKHQNLLSLLSDLS